MTDANVLLEMRSISKRFPGVLALDGVNFRARASEIHALMGENGAGKSTLIKIITGAYTPDAGKILLSGSPIAPVSPRAAEALGISAVHQEINLIPQLSVAENICLGREPTRFGMIRWRAVARRAADALSRLGLKIDTRRELASYSIAIQQMVAIARALDVSAKLLIFDEPTSSLDAGEVSELFAVLRRLREQGLGIVFVTHFIDQVYAISDGITVLRDGRLVGEFETPRLARVDLVSRMIGRDLHDVVSAPAAPPAADRRRAAPAFLEARGIGRRNAVAPLDLTINHSEVVGLAGLLGSGRTETARLLFGVDKPDSGEVRAHGQRYSSPREAIALGLGFTPEDRKREGIVP